MLLRLSRIILILSSIHMQVHVFANPLDLRATDRVNEFLVHHRSSSRIINLTSVDATPKRPTRTGSAHYDLAAL